VGDAALTNGFGAGVDAFVGGSLSGGGCACIRGSSAMLAARTTAASSSRQSLVADSMIRSPVVAPLWSVNVIWARTFDGSLVIRIVTRSGALAVNGSRPSRADTLERNSASTAHAGDIRS
jgi:hypothetical protein